MNDREKRFLGIGLGAGLSLALAIGGAIAAVEHGSHTPPNDVVPASPTARTTDTDAGTMPGETVQLTADDQKAAGVQIAAVRRQHLVTTVDAFGRVEEPESNLSAIPARVAGRVDKLYLQYTGQNIRRGQPIAEIYSPDLASTIAEYKLALDSRGQLPASAQPEALRAADDLVASSRQRLALWGVTPKQIDGMQSGATPTDVAVYSPVSGTVIERKVTQGQYVNAGDTLYSVADLSTVWVKADVYEFDLPQIKAGQPVEITSDALLGQTIRGSVEFVEPQASKETRTIPVHVHVPNPGMRLRPGMFVRAVFATHKADALVVPRSAVLDTGVRKLVYLARDNGVFEAREVNLGTPNNDLFPVLDGLKEGDRVVVNGNFLIDSQTRLTGGMSGMFGGSKEYTDHANHGGAPPATGAVKLDYRTDPQKLKGAAPATYHVRLTDASGKPVTDAQVTVTLVMPAMPAMHMPEMRSGGPLTWTGSEYVGSVNVPMSGSMNATIEASRNGQVIASAHIRVQAE